MGLLVKIYTLVVVFYVASLNTVYLLLSLVSLAEYLRHMKNRVKGRSVGRVNLTFTLPVSLIVPAYNEEMTIVKAVQFFLRIDYPEHEVVVVNDGSTDRTLEVLKKEFKLYPVRRPYRKVLETAPVRMVYYSRQYRNLVVVDKENGGKSDALNAGLNIASYPYVCTLDADSVLERDALVKIMQPFFEERGRVVAVSGVVRVVNGNEVDNRGMVRVVRLPRSLLARLQVVEYFRAFLGMRLGFSRLGSLLIASGAFAAFEKNTVLQAGGFCTATVGEDMEIVVRIRRYSYLAGRPGKIVFVPDPIVWTQVPETLGDLQRQRRRWQKGLTEVLIRHRVMIFNPRYGSCGLIAMPYQFIYEFLGPFVETTGYIVVPLAWLFGFINETAFWVYLTAEFLYGTLISLVSVFYSEFSEKPYADGRDFAWLILLAFLENLGYRQLTVLWRLQGVWDAVCGRQGWAKPARTGL